MNFDAPTASVSIPGAASTSQPGGLPLVGEENAHTSPIVNRKSETACPFGKISGQNARFRICDRRNAISDIPQRGRRSAKFNGKPAALPIYPFTIVARPLPLPPATCFTHPSHHSLVSQAWESSIGVLRTLVYRYNPLLQSPQNHCKFFFFSQIFSLN